MEETSKAVYETPQSVVMEIMSDGLLCQSAEWDAYGNAIEL